MASDTLALIFFFYGLAFFSMGLAITLEIGHISDPRLRRALQPLAAFGLVHGTHEWIEMLEILGLLDSRVLPVGIAEAMRIGILAFSFLMLSAFGVSLLAPDSRPRRLVLGVPLGQAAAWGIGLFALRSRFPGVETLADVGDVWTRYILAVPSGLLACAGLVAQQRRFHREGMPRFGRDSLWAAVAFAAYGAVGQVFTRPSPLPPSDVVNSDLFLSITGFPVQLLRASAAIVVAVFVVRFMRSWEVGIQRELAELQAARLQEAERREMERGDLLRKVVAAQEAERTRIARELHDATGQTLTAIGLGLRGISGILYHDLERASSNLREMQALVAQSLTELQHVIADLRPSHLDDLGLPAALRWYAGEVTTRSGLEVDVDVVGEPRPMPGETTTALFRVAQEALTNALKHAEASAARVMLEYHSDRVELTVSDNGRGFDPASIEHGHEKAWGLAGMRERAALAGGLLDVQSAIGAGTRIRIMVPHSERSEASA